MKRNEEILLQVMAFLIFIFCLIGAEAKTLWIAGVCFVVSALLLVPVIWMCMRYENNNDDFN